MSIERLKLTEKCFRVGQMKYSYDYILEYMQQTIIAFRGQQEQITELKSKVKLLEKRDNCYLTEEELLKEKVGGTDPD